MFLHATIMVAFMVFVWGHQYNFKPVPQSPCDQPDPIWGGYKYASFTMLWE